MVFSFSGVSRISFDLPVVPQKLYLHLKILKNKGVDIPFLICPLQGPSISHFSFLFIFVFFVVFSFLFPFHTTISLIVSFSSHNHDAYEVQSNHILTSTIFQDIILFTPIMFHNFQEFTQRFFLHSNHHKLTINLYIIKT